MTRVLGVARLPAIEPAQVTASVRDPAGRAVTFTACYGALAHAIFFRARSLGCFHTHYARSRWRWALRSASRCGERPRAGQERGRPGRPRPGLDGARERAYRAHVSVAPNRAAVENAFTVRVTRDGRPVRGAEVLSRFDMLDMEMGEQSYRLRELRPGRSRSPRRRS